MDSVFIDDGYTRQGYIAAAPRLHGALRCTYRPALPEERFEFVRQQDPDARAYCRRMAAWLDKHVLGWDAKNSKGESVAKGPEAFLRLHPEVLNKLYEQVMGYSAGDAEADEKN